MTAPVLRPLPDDEDLLLRAKEVAAFCQVGPATILRWRKAGILRRSGALTKRELRHALANLPRKGERGLATRPLATRPPKGERGPATRSELEARVRELRSTDSGARGRKTID